MTETRLTLRLHNAQQGYQSVLDGWRFAKAWLTAGYRLVMTLAVDDGKSREQEKKYHAQIDDIARQYVHAGRKWGQEDMKRLLVDAFRHETKGDPDLAPLWAEMGDMHLAPAIGRDGFVALGIQTRKFPKKLASAFVEWLNAFGAENDIVWSDPQQERMAA